MIGPALVLLVLFTWVAVTLILLKHAPLGIVTLRVPHIEATVLIAWPFTWPLIIMLWIRWRLTS
jgi:hypothetical protein